MSGLKNIVDFFLIVGSVNALNRPVRRSFHSNEKKKLKSLRTFNFFFLFLNLVLSFVSFSFFFFFWFFVLFLLILLVFRPRKFKRLRYTGIYVTIYILFSGGKLRNLL